MKKDSEYGMAIGNLTAQAGSNLNLSDFDSYIVNELKLNQYIRYVDDIVIISKNKNKLIDTLPLIVKKLILNYTKEVSSKVNKTLEFDKNEYIFRRRHI